MRVKVPKLFSSVNCAVWIWKLPVAVGLDRYIIAQHGSETVKVAFFVGHGDQTPVAVSAGIFVT
jgi:hypothetical protein